MNVYFSSLFDHLLTPELGDHLLHLLEKRVLPGVNIVNELHTSLCWCPFLLTEAACSGQVIHVVENDKLALVSKAE